MNTKETITFLADKIAELEKRSVALECSHQTLLKILLDNSPKAKEVAIATLEAMVENQDKNNPLTIAFSKSLKHLQHEKPLSPEELRKTFRVMGNAKKEKSEQ